MNIFLGGLVSVYQYGKNSNLGLFCGVENEDFVEPDTVSKFSIEHIIFII